MSDLRQPAATRLQSIVLLTLAWLVLQIGGLFAPGLLDDVDSIYIEVAREMLHRHDYVTPYIDGIRFFDKPPLMYWMAAASMHLFGEHAWAARLPLALAVLGLLLSVYALGLRLFGGALNTQSAERGAFYAALATATALGPYLYTRFFIPDILICIWMTLGVHLFLVAVDRISSRRTSESFVDGLAWSERSALLPCLGFAVVLALNLLTKGLIGLVFPLAFAGLYLVLAGKVRLLKKLHLLPSLVAFTLVALPWHILVAFRNPAIAMPAGVGLPPHAGWAWFYLYNEHVARFLGQRIPRDYGNTPVWVFWLFAVVWIAPWAAFLPAAFARVKQQLSQQSSILPSDRDGALALTLWALIVMVFFSISNRQEYYSLPALPAVTLMIGGALGHAEASVAGTSSGGAAQARRLALSCHQWLLLPLALILAGACLFFALTAPHPRRGTDIASLLASNPALYNLSLGHLFDLTGAAMGLFRGPLLTVAAGMLVLGPGAFFLRQRGLSYAANLTMAAGSVIVLLAVHSGLARFYPVLGSRELGLAILAEQRKSPARSDQPPDRIVADGELTSASSLLFYTRQPLHLLNGRVNGPWFGSFWPDAPAIFETDQTLRQEWAGPQRVFLLTYHPDNRSAELAAVGPVNAIASAGGKTILSNR